MQTWLTSGLKPIVSLFRGKGQPKPAPAPQDGYEYDIFVSYRSKDARATAVWLSRNLRSFHAPQDFGLALPTIRVYRDQEVERVAYDIWLNRIRLALLRSRFLLVVLTPSVLEKGEDGGPNWVVREMMAFIEAGRASDIMFALGPGMRAFLLPDEVRKHFEEVGFADLRRTATWWSRLRFRDLLAEKITAIVVPTLGLRDEDIPKLNRLAERERLRNARILATVSATAASLFLIVAMVAVVQTLRARKQQHAANLQTAQTMFAQGDALQQALRPNAAAAYFLRALKIASATYRDDDAERLRIKSWQRFRHLALSPTQILQGNLEPILAIDISRDGRTAATGSGRWQAGLGSTKSADDAVRLWDISSGKELAVLEGHPADVIRVKFNSAATMVASASQDGTIRIWNVHSRAWRCEARVKEFRTNVATLTLSADGARFFLAGDSPWYAKLSPPMAWNSRSCLPTALRAHAAGAQEQRLFWDDEASPRMWTASLSGKIGSKWSPSAAYPRSGGWYEIGAATLNAAGTLAAVGPASSHPPIADDSVIVWNAARGSIFRRLVGHSGDVRALAFSSDGRLLATGGDDGTIKIWDVQSGDLTETLEGHSGAIRSVAFLPDSQSVLSGATDRTFRHWTLPRRPLESVLPGAVFRSVAAPNRRYRYQTNATSDGFHLEQRDARSSRLLKTVKSKDGVDAMAISPDSRYLATAEGKHVFIRDSNTLQTSATLQGLFDEFTETFAIDGDSKIVATADAEFVRGWHTSTGTLAWTVQRDSDTSGSIAIVRGGTEVAGACGQTEICFWNVVDGRLDETLATGASPSKAPNSRMTINLSTNRDGTLLFCQRYQTGATPTITVLDTINGHVLSTRAFPMNYVFAVLAEDDNATALVSTGSWIYEWDFRGDDIVTQWKSAHVIHSLEFGGIDGTYVGVTDPLGIVQWVMPPLIAPSAIPLDIVEDWLKRYDDIAGVDVSNSGSSGHEVSPRSNEPSADALTAMLASNDAYTVLRALTWIEEGDVAHPELFDRVVPKLRSSDSRIRNAAILALARPGVPPSRAAEVIAPLIADQNSDVRFSALIVIGNFTENAAPAIPYLIQALSIVQPLPTSGAMYSTQSMACDDLGRIGSAAASAIPAILRVLERPITPEAGPFRSSCVAALGQIRDTREEVIDALLNALKSRDVNTRIQAAVALAKLPMTSDRIVNALALTARTDNQPAIDMALQTVRNRQRSDAASH